jgi:CDP-4-dehydro-6-deoxyglucose reductase, E1
MEIIITKNKTTMNNFYLPLMSDNIDKEDVNALIDFLSQDQIPKLTNGPKVVEFENKWGEWLGTKYNLMVNSGASANELTMLALNYIHGNGEIIIPPLTWISDISSVIFSGFKPVFCDINLKNFSFDIEQLKQAITPNTKAIFLTHVLGINGLTDKLLQLCKEKNILLIEDVCESHGTTFKGQKVGSIGFASNFSFYFAHHMSTIEGGMICTNDEHFYQVCRALRSHGMTREITNEDFKHKIIQENPDLNPDFIFLHPAHNFRSTELNAVIGLSQIKKLDSNNIHRVNNFKYFMERLDSNKYHTDIELEGQCNYAFIVVLKENSFEKRNNVESTLKEKGIEFRRGLSGGGNQLRQPYFKKNYNINYNNFKNVDHIHNFSWYIGNYPTLEQEKINTLINILNNI